ncbi:MAG TPA: gluconate 2-dehydrogenase subunit 3 family protein [Vicinamibacterales bacterium]|nr:gluconate 2-dehydrogenase subunit 3 family protein [Vicinamibacterales bacterium]
MSDEELDVIRTQSRSLVGRRELLQALLGAAVALPALAADHPLRRHAENGETLDQAEKKARAADWKPEFLDRHQFATLQSLADRIVPGSTRAKVSEFVDQLLVVDSPENQRKFLGALGAFDGQALQRASRPWVQLTESDQIGILREASTLETGTGLRDHFDLLKGWIAGAYYSSEIGMKELGWTGMSLFQSYPGCEHPGGHS